MPGFPIKQPIMLSFICPTAVTLYHLLTFPIKCQFQRRKKRRKIYSCSTVKINCSLIPIAYLSLDIPYKWKQERVCLSLLDDMFILPSELICNGINFQSTRSLPSRQQFSPPWLNKYVDQFFIYCG